MSNTYFTLTCGMYIQVKNIADSWRLSNKQFSKMIGSSKSVRLKLHIIGVETNRNGSTYITWESDNGNIYYSNFKDYKKIVLNVPCLVGGWYDGIYCFATRGGKYRSLCLANTNTNLVDEPVAE
jgi:hypothetical protein